MILSSDKILSRSTLPKPDLLKYLSITKNYYTLTASFCRSIRGRRHFLFLALVLTGLLCFIYLDIPYYSSKQYSNLRPIPIPQLKPSEVLDSSSTVPVRRDLLSMVVPNVNLTTKIPEDVSTRSETSKIFQVTSDNTALPSKTSKAYESSTVKIISTTEMPTEIGVIKNKTTPEEKRTFSKVMAEFDWSSYITAVNNNRTLMKIYLEKFILEMSYFLVLPPTVPINSECKAPPLAPPEQINCSDYSTGLTGVQNNQIAKIGIFIIFGFDVDVLEIYLNEVYDVVHKIFIIESTKSHLMTLPKPLMWEEVKHQKRFIKFAPKVVHMIVDDAQNEDVMIKTNSNGDIWLMEKLQEKLKWEKFLEWNKANNFFSGDDVLGFGDADEIPSRKMLNVLKYCELKDGFLNFGIWFPFGNINQAFIPDWPVKDRPYTFGNPPFRTLRNALDVPKNTGEAPGRTFGKSPNFLVGGMHMTHYGYLPFQLVKHITATEYSPFSIDEATKLSNISKSGDIRAFELEYAAVPRELRGRIVSLRSISEEMKDIAILPWFYDCNRDRYPVWEGRHDSRLD